ncbi:excisionase [Brucella anthropi]|uniref:excisionase n=1 Tax=Brucella anthropi TaxID=529 RepID=UPI001FFD2A6B|nr:excisionase [Brucella anthropi]
MNLKIESVSDDTPLRLEHAVRLAFPDGSMKAAGLRKERDAGRLQTELIAGKEYVTLAAIREMRELCRGRRKERASSGATRAAKAMALSETAPGGSSAMGKNSSALAAARQAASALKSRSQHTSTKNTSPRGKGDVTPIKS